VANALGRWLAAQEARRHGWDESRLHASDLGATLDGEGCLRQVWLRLHGAEGKKDGPGKELMFEHAHRIHEMMVEVLEHLGEEWEVSKVESPIDGLFAQEQADGRLDVLLTHRPSGVRLVYDTKTVRGAAFRWMSEVEEIGFPWVHAKPGHQLQVQAYARAEQADGGLIVYVDREGQNWLRLALVPRDDEAVEVAAAALQEAALAEEAPPVLAMKEKLVRGKRALKMPWQCEWCQYLDISCDGAKPREETP
jgi:hypothetical protein